MSRLFYQRRSRQYSLDEALADMVEIGTYPQDRTNSHQDISWDSSFHGAGENQAYTLYAARLFMRVTRAPWAMGIDQCSLDAFSWANCPGGEAPLAREIFRFRALTGRLLESKA